MRRMVRLAGVSLLLAASLILPGSTRLQAWWGICSISCEPCYGPNSCPDYNGQAQSCGYDVICP